MSPKVPIINRCRGISAHRRSGRLGGLEVSRCWASQACTSDIANLRCSPNRLAVGSLPCTRQVQRVLSLNVRHSRFLIFGRQVDPCLSGAYPFLCGSCLQGHATFVAAVARGLRVVGVELIPAHGSVVFDGGAGQGIAALRESCQPHTIHQILGCTRTRLRDVRASRRRSQKREMFRVPPHLHGYGNTRARARGGGLSYQRGR
ncbi:MAG: hypothetical protein JWM50_655 [Microbacteriaceae bacterium]|nr:hypothetical protein [Microbacteriaceae bacterium]